MNQPEIVFGGCNEDNLVTHYSLLITPGKA